MNKPSKKKDFVLMSILVLGLIVFIPTTFSQSPSQKTRQRSRAEINRATASIHTDRSLNAILREERISEGMFGNEEDNEDLITYSDDYVDTYQAKSVPIESEEEIASDDWSEEEAK